MVREYRRFLVLTQVAGTQVCPSDDVDQAWHLHITRTVDYERFCRDALGRFVHHRPAEPGADEHQRHRGMYAGTLALYRRAFLAEAPRDVWPDVERRFAPPAAPPDSIRLQGGWASASVLAGVGLAAALGLALLLNQLGALDATHGISGPDFLRFAVPATMLLMLLGGLSSAPFAPASPRDTLDAYEAAWLSGGTPRVAATAIGMLIELGRLELRTTVEGVGWRRRRATRLVVADAANARALHPVESACLLAARDGVMRFDRADIAVRGCAMRIRARLRVAGLAGDGATIAPTRAAVAIVLAGWLAVEIERLLHALTTARPLQFLAMLIVATAVAFVLLTLRDGRPTWRGRRALGALGQRLRTERALAAGARPERAAAHPVTSPRLLALTLALLGPAAVLAQPGFSGLDEAIGPDGMRLARAGDGSWGGGCGG